MTPTKTLAKAAILIVLFSIAAIGIFSEPDEASTHWLADFILSKSIGAISIFIYSVLYKRWGRPTLSHTPRNETHTVKQYSDAQ